jgi:hypothetical protein
MQAGVVFLGTRAALDVTGFAGVNLMFVTLWLIVVALVYREHKRLTSLPQEH